jgi:hypothetical protein
MGHTQTTQNNINRPCALVRAKKYFFLLSRHGRGHVPCADLCAVKAHKTHHARAGVAI